MIKSDSLRDNFYATQKTFREQECDRDNHQDLSLLVKTKRNSGTNSILILIDSNLYQKKYCNIFFSSRDLILTFWCNHAICHKLIKNRLQNFPTGIVFFYVVCNGTKLSSDIISNWLDTVFENHLKKSHFTTIFPFQIQSTLDF